ncbi:MAG: hypothetical protein U1G08_21685 [Verrucomicrobiota bacterium]
MPNPISPWPHAPVHQLAVGGTFFVTSSTYLKAHHFRGANRLRVLHRGLLTVGRDYGWRFEAWAVFSNHYHFVAHSPSDSPNAETLGEMLKTLHVRTSAWINRQDGTPTRQVWFNFWETRLTFPKSLLVRLNYTHQNPVKHGLVTVANQYPWCSAGWFERTASPSQIRTIYRFRSDKLRISDDFHPSPEW